VVSASICFGGHELALVQRAIGGHDRGSNLCAAQVNSNHGVDLRSTHNSNPSAWQVYG
jgi:hypothetical protein